jgi:MYXO-CTERM domain-containing protein
MAKRNARVNSAFVLPVAITAASLFAVSVAGTATAAGLRVVTPGEQNTQSGENGCAAAPCANGHWFHYPEILAASLGAAYSVVNNGDGGAVLGCDAATAAAAGGNSICANGGNYSKSINPLPDIVIIGPFGEHDQRIVAGPPAMPALYDEPTFEAAYDGLVTNYLNLSSHPKVYMMTPIDITPTWNGAATTLGAGKDIVKDIMLPAALAVATKHSLVVIDTYTAMSPDGVLDTAYMPADGQVNSAGQQKMAMMILDALQSDAGTTAGSGSSSGAATSGATSGSTSGSASGASTTGSTSGTATAGSTGSGTATSGSTTSGTATSGTVTASGSGTMSGTSTTGSGMTQTGTGASAGTGGGAAAGTSTSGTPAETAPATKSSSGCALSSGRSSSAVGLGLLALGLVAVRRRRSV